MNGGEPKRRRYQMDPETVPDDDLERIQTGPNHAFPTIHPPKNRASNAYVMSPNKINQPQSYPYAFSPREIFFCFRAWGLSLALIVLSPPR